MENNRLKKYRTSGKILQYLFRVTSLIFGLILINLNIKINHIFNEPVFYIFIALLVLYNLLLLNYYDYLTSDLKSKRLYLLILVDFSISAFIVFISGGIESPFIYYMLSPVLLAGYYFGYIFVSLVALSLSLTMFGITIAKHSFQIIAISQSQIKMLFQISFYYFLSGYLIAFLSKTYLTAEKTADIYLMAKSKLEAISQKNTNINKQLFNLLDIYEKFQIVENNKELIKRILSGCIILGSNRAVFGLCKDDSKRVEWMKVDKNIIFKSFQSSMRNELETVLRKIKNQQQTEKNSPLLIDKNNLAIFGLADLIDEIGMENIIVVPMTGKQKTKGILILEPDDKIDFEQESLILSSYASEISLALDNLEKHEILIKQIQILESLNEVATAITSKFTLESILNTVVEQAKDIIKAEKVILSLADVDGNSNSLDPNYFTVRGKIDQYPEIYWREQMEELARDVISTGNSRIITVKAEKHKKNRKVWLLCVPIKIRDKSSGVISVINSYSRSFEVIDVMTIETLGKFAAVAVENVNLVQKSQELTISEERGRIARDMHDGLAQALFSVILNLQITENIIGQNPNSAIVKLREIKDFTQQNLTQLRHYIYNLQPPDVNRFGLTKALELYLNQTAKINNLEIVFQVEGENQNLSARTELSIYRIAQEAAANAVKHSKANKIESKLQFKDGSIFLIFQDDGMGFDVNELQKNRKTDHGMGLNNIKRRIENFGGVFKIESRPGEGTKIITQIPIQ